MCTINGTLNIIMYFATHLFFPAIIKFSVQDKINALILRSMIDENSIDIVVMIACNV